MIKYYCPYCNPNYQFTKESKNGNLICGFCGEDLIKIPFIKVNQIVAFISAGLLLFPLLFSLFLVIKNQIDTPSDNYQAKNNFGNNKMIVMHKC